MAGLEFVVPQRGGESIGRTAVQMKLVVDGRAVATKVD
jgi:hypothetical protein